jgi:hypothetical protein
MAHGTKAEIARLPHLKGLRAWATELDELPNVAADLLQATNRLQLIPIAIIFDFCDGEWAVALVADD